MGSRRSRRVRPPRRARRCHKVIQIMTGWRAVSRGRLDLLGNRDFQPYEKWSVSDDQPSVLYRVEHAVLEQ